MKIYNYTDGVRRTELRVSFTLSAEDFRILLCSLYRDHHAEYSDPLPTFTRKTLVEAVRKELKSRGANDFYYWSDEMDEDDVERLTEWARSEVSRLFPEF